ncbi:MAG: lipoate--protein ligase family protein [Isosphaeraceae bacterium]
MENGLDLSSIDLTLPTVAENLALDEALLLNAENSPFRIQGVLRFWEAPDFAVVLGASRRLAQDVHLEACHADLVPIFRRTSGGGTVVIGPGALNVTVVLPETAAPGLRAVATAQEFVLQKIAFALGTSGRLVEVRGLGDLTIGGRKFGGSAQRRIRDWFLVHCSVLYDFPLERISRYLASPSRQPAYRAGRTHDEFLMNLGLPRKILLDLIRAAWSSVCQLSPTPDVLRPLLDQLLAERFANRAWIERL